MADGLAGDRMGETSACPNRPPAGPARTIWSGPSVRWPGTGAPLADEVLQRLPRIDVLVNNVGGYWNTRHLTADGFERTFALNHLAPFLLTNLMFHRPKQSGPARVVTVSSNAHVTGRIDFEDLQGERSYSGAEAYSQSKPANVLFTYELARKLRG